MQSEVSKAIAKQKQVMGTMQHNVQGFTEEENKMLNSQYPQSEELDISEGDMLDILGEAAAGKVKAVEAEVVDVSATSPGLGDIETQLGSILEQVKAIEADLKVSGKKE